METMRTELEEHLKKTITTQLKREFNKQFEALDELVEAKENAQEASTSS